jgi:uncharacterized membrane protein YkvA (DUF1232 family)
MSETLRARWHNWWERKRKPPVSPRVSLRARFRTWFERGKARAAQAVETPKEAERIAERAEQKAVRQGKLRQAWSDMQLMVRLVRAWARGEYREVSRGTIALIIGALAYFVTPLDAIFDHLPLGGYVDDAAVLAWVISEVRAELEAFKAWEAKKLSAPAAPPALGPATGSSQPS